MTYIVVATLFAIIAIAFLAGHYVRSKMRMPETGWKVTLMLMAIGIAGVILFTSWPPKQGIDLKGGIILIYQVDQELTRQNAANQMDEEDAADRENLETASVEMGALIQALSRRINPSGVSEIVIRKYGDDQVEIIIPDVSQTEAEQVKKLITTGGFLKFMIVANNRDHDQIWTLADTPNQVGQYQVRDDDGNVIGQWAKLDIDNEATEAAGQNIYRVDPPNAKSRVVRGHKEVLMVVDPRFDLQGTDLKRVRAGFKDISPCVFFDMTANGAKLLGGLTGTNLPDESTNHFSLLGIVMDGVLLSAPRINDRITTNGIIEGSFTKDEVDFLVNVLQAGNLPAVLQSEPLSQNEISPLLGEDTIEQGKRAIAISLVAVLVFMIVYYHFAGIISCIAVLLNLAFVLALMIFVGAAFSLPGMAGLVLTVGMSVDANVLIFERIREELRNGATLRMSIRNGFGRATRTIVDANVTTLITAIVLYAIGNEQLRAFAVTLIFGILMCLFTAIFCSRIIFDIAERRRWVKRLTMLQMFATPSWDLMGKRRLAAVASILVILVGLGAVYARGNTLFDIDFRGGTSIQVLLSAPKPIKKVRDIAEKLRTDNTVENVSVTAVLFEDKEKYPDGSIYRIDTSLPGSNAQQEGAIETVQAAITEVFSDGDGSFLKMQQFSFTTPEKPTSDSPELPTVDDESGAASEETNEAEDNAAADQAAELAGVDTLNSRSTLKFEDTVNAETIDALINETAEELGVTVPGIVLRNKDWDEKSSMGYREWQLDMSFDPEQANQILTKLQENLNNTPVWLASNHIGSSVAGDKTRMAIAAVIASLLGIIGYIWIRFQRVVFGLAAVVALIHDVLITLGAIGLSAWLANTLGFLMIDEFKISLPVVAAFLTIIGYSLNDTIVVFDRIREVRGKSHHLNPEIINKSINQTLSRTVLTSLTTMLAVLILYVLGGQGIHAFAFALIVGVLVGTYSSIFVASPMLLWMSGSKQPENVREKVAA